MSTQLNRRTTLYGYPNPQAGLQQEPIVAQRDPIDGSDQAEPGVTWVNTSSNAFFINCAANNAPSVWQSTTGGATTLASLTVDPGNATVTAGNLAVTAGTLTVGGATSLQALAAKATTIVGATSITGNTTISGDLAVSGNVTLTGDFDITDTASISLTSTNNAAGAITLFTNGGTSETILIESAQGTGTAAVNIKSDAGGVSLTGAKAAATALNLIASDAAGGLTSTVGTGGYSFAATNGAFSLTTGSGAINLGTDTVAHTITLGNSTGATSVVLNNGTGALNLGTNAIAHQVNIGNNTGATAIAINGGTGAAGSIAIGTTANDVPITIGNSTGATAVLVNAGTSGVGIGTNAIAHPITIGNITGATGVTVNSGTNGFTVNTTGTGDATFNTGDEFQVIAAGAIDLGASAPSNFTVTGAGLDLSLESVGGSVIIEASEATADAIQLTASDAAGGLAIAANGLVSVVPATDTQASPTAASTKNFNVIRVIFTGFTTAAAGTQAFTITSSKILTTSGVLVNVTNRSAGNDAQMQLQGTVQALGSLTINTKNVGSQALDSDVIITVWIIS